VPFASYPAQPPPKSPPTTPIGTASLPATSLSEEREIGQRLAVEQMLQRSASAAANSRRIETEKASVLKARQDDALRKVFESRRRAQEQGLSPNRPPVASVASVSPRPRNMSTTPRFGSPGTAATPASFRPTSFIPPNFSRRPATPSSLPQRPSPPSRQTPAVSARPKPRTYASNASAPSFARPAAASSPFFTFKQPAGTTPSKPAAWPAGVRRAASTNATPPKATDPSKAADPSAVAPSPTPSSAAARTAGKGLDISLASRAAQGRQRQPARPASPSLAGQAKPAGGGKPAEGAPVIGGPKVKPSASQWLPRGATTPRASPAPGGTPPAKPKVAVVPPKPRAASAAAPGGGPATGPKLAAKKGVAPKPNAAQWLPRGVKLSGGAPPPPPASK